MGKIVNVSLKQASEKWWPGFEDLKWRDKKSLSSLIQDACQEYYQNHKDGNPGYTMDQFIENPDLKAVPAFFRHRDAWHEYVDKLTEKDAKELLAQAQTITALADRKVNYGSAGASVQSN